MYSLSRAEDIMQIFIDSADIDEIKEALSWGIVSGITTNPALIQKAAKKHGMDTFGRYLDEILNLVRKKAPRNSEGTVSLEVIGQAHEGETLDACLIREGTVLWERFNRVAENVVIKVPINPWTQQGDDKYAGIKAVNHLSKKEIKTNVTLVHSPAQAIMAAEAGATYASPFLGGLDDAIAPKTGRTKDKFGYYPREGESEGHYGIAHDSASMMVSGAHLVETIAQIYRIQEYETKILAASLRHPVQVAEAAAAGAHLATIPFPVLEKMLDHPLTKDRMDAFTAAADDVPEYKKLFETETP